MSRINNNWYNLQTTRKYPLLDTVSGYDDNALKLPDNVIADCRLRWPQPAGQIAFIAGLTITDNIVTVVIQAASSLNTAGAFVPLAVITLPQPVDTYRYYPLQAIYPGTGGFIVFGDLTPRSVRFSSPRQSALSPECGGPYNPLPVVSLRKENRVNTLDGLVKLIAGPDVSVLPESVTIAGRPRAALVVRLLQSINSRNVLDVYRGACTDRPESQTCQAEPITDVNGVVPDCTGNINIEFRNMTPGDYLGCGSLAAGTTLDQPVGMGDVCTPVVVNRFKGTDLCHGNYSSSSMGLPSTSLMLSSMSGGEGSEDFSPTFITPEAEVETYSGTIITTTHVPDPPTYTANDPSQTNLAVLNVPDTTVGKRVSVDVLLIRALAQSNAGILLNLVERPNSPGSVGAYLALVLDRAAGQLKLVRFNGRSLIVEHAAAVSAVALETWYTLVAEIRHTTGGVLISVTASSTDPAWSLVQFSVVVSKYGDPYGGFGIYTDRARAQFTNFFVGDV